MWQAGFFDLDNRFSKLDEKDPLVNLIAFIDWENFRSTLNKVRRKDRKSNTGRKSFLISTIAKLR